MGNGEWGKETWRQCDRATGRPEMREIQTRFLQSLVLPVAPSPCRIVASFSGVLDLRPNRSICYGRESGIPWNKLWAHQSD
jgi:hypothetical protein